MYLAPFLESDINMYVFHVPSISIWSYSFQLNYFHRYVGRLVVLVANVHAVGIGTYRIPSICLRTDFVKSIDGPP